MLVYQRVNQAIPHMVGLSLAVPHQTMNTFFFKFFACATIVTGKLLMVWQGNRYIDIHRYPSFPKNWEYYAWEGGEQPPWRWNSGTEVPEFSDETLSDDLPKAWWERWGERKWTSHGPEPVPIRWTCSGAILNFQTFSSRLLQMSLVPTSIQVVVFFGRAAVHLPRHGTSGSSWLVARYGGGCLQRFGPFPVRRATWFRLPSGQLEPYGEKMNWKLVIFFGGDYPVVGKELRSYDSIREVFFPDNQEHRD